MRVSVGGPLGAAYRLSAGSPGSLDGASSREVTAPMSSQRIIHDVRGPPLRLWVARISQTSGGGAFRNLVCEPPSSC